MLRREAEFIQYAEYHIRETRDFNLRIRQIDIDDKIGMPCQDLLCPHDGFPDNPLPEFREERIRFQDRNELIRRNHAVDVILPAEQGFRTGQRFGLCIHNRLEKQEEAFIPAHDGGTDRIQLFHHLVVLSIQAVPELDHGAMPAYLRLPVGKIQAGIYCL